MPINIDLLKHKQNGIKRALPPIVELNYHLNGVFPNKTFLNLEEEKSFYFNWWVWERYKIDKWNFRDFGFIGEYLNDYDEPFLEIDETYFISYWNYYFWMIYEDTQKHFDIINDINSRRNYLNFLYENLDRLHYPILPSEKARLGKSLFIGENELFEGMLLKSKLTLVSNTIDTLIIQSNFLFDKNSRHQIEIPDSYLNSLKSNIKVNSLFINKACYLFGKYLNLQDPTPNTQKSYFESLRFNILGLACRPEVREVLVGELNLPAKMEIKKNPENDAINVLGYPLAEFGLGEDCRMTIKALSTFKKIVNPFSLSPVSSGHQQSDKSIVKSTSNYLYEGCSIVNTTLQNFPYFYFEYGSSFFDNQYIIGSTQWELPNWPKELKNSYYFLNEIWAPSKFIQECHQNQSIVPVIHMNLPVEIPNFLKQDRSFHGIKESDFVFFFMFDFNSSIYRKNPHALVRAFISAFPEDKTDVKLILKSMYVDENNPYWGDFVKLISNDSRIKLINKVLPKQDIYSLLSNSDVFISLHRSEGFGRCIAEAMYLNIPVVTTGYSGNMDFCNFNNCFIVDYKMVPVQKNEYIYSTNQEWAEPILESAVEQMRLVYNSSELRNQKRKLAKQEISKFNAIEVGLNMKKRLSEIGF